MKVTFFLLVVASAAFLTVEAQDPAPSLTLVDPADPSTSYKAALATGTKPGASSEEGGPASNSDEEDGAGKGHKGGRGHKGYKEGKGGKGGKGGWGKGNGNKNGGGPKGGQHPGKGGKGGKGKLGKD